MLERLGKLYEGFVGFLEGIGLPECAENVEADGFKGDIITACDEELIDLGMSRAIDRLRFRVLFQRELLKKTPEVREAFPVDQVAAFFKEKRVLAKCAAAVEENGIDGEMLLLADNEVLKELGVPAAGVRVIRNQFMERVAQSLSIT